MKISFNQIVSKLTLNEKKIGGNFLPELSLELIELFESKVDIINKDGCRFKSSFIEKCKNYLSQTINEKENQDSLDSQIKFNIDILIFIMKGITEGIFYKQQKHLQNENYEQDKTKREKLCNSVVEINNNEYKRIKKAILLIDDVDLFIYGNNVDEYDRTYIQIIEDAMKIDIKEKSTSNISFILTSDFPLSKRRDETPYRVCWLDFVDIILKTNSEESFAEITFGHFYRIATANKGNNERKPHLNKLQILIEDLKKDKLAIVNYFKNTDSAKETELNAKILEIFSPDYEKDAKEQEIEEEIIQRVYEFFSFIFKQPLFGLKNHYKTMLHCSKDFTDSLKNNNIPLETDKLHTSKFLTFLMHPSKEGSICLVEEPEWLTKTKPESFWHGYYVFRNRFKTPFLRPFSEVEIKTLYEPVDHENRNSVLQTMYNIFHFGHIALKPAQLTDGKLSFELDFANHQQKMTFETQYNKNYSACHQGYPFYPNEKQEFMKAFNLDFWRGVIIPDLRTQIYSALECESNSNINEELFRKTVEYYLETGIASRIKRKYPILHHMRMNRYVDIVSDVRKNKNNTGENQTGNLKEDLLITLRSGNDIMDKCLVIIEFTIDTGKPTNLGTLAENNMSYQTLDLDLYGHKIYISASLNRKGSEWAKKAMKMECFLDNKL